MGRLAPTWVELIPSRWRARVTAYGAQRLFGNGARPVDGDLALRWKGSASPETAMAAENPTPSEPLDP
jgi:hypothetical protein